MIDIKNITKSFGALQVLKGIDLHIDKGEVVSIVGPSGAGKTTLLQIIGTLDRPDTGTVRVDGIDVTSSFRFQKHAFGLCIPVSPVVAGVHGHREYYDSCLYCR